MGAAGLLSGDIFGFVIWVCVLVVVWSVGRLSLFAGSTYVFAHR